MRARGCVCVVEGAHNEIVGFAGIPRESVAFFLLAL